MSDYNMFQIIKRSGTFQHRRTGLEIWGGGQTRICPTRAEGARTSRGVWGHALQENFEK